MHKLDPYLMNFSAPKTDLVEPPVGDLKCDICELIIKGLDSIIGKNASEEKVNATIYELCNDLSGSAKAFVSSTMAFLSVCLSVCLC